MASQDSSDVSGQIEVLQQTIVALEAEIKCLKKKADDKEWSLRKTNEGVKILYKELERKNRELQKIDQLKSDFVSTVSHELRTPLAITNEGINLVLEGILGPVSAEQKRILQRGKENLNRLKLIIDDLLDISKIEAGKIELNKQFVDFRAIVRELVDSYGVVVAVKNISLRVDMPEDEILLYVDEGRMIQILNNLLNNAVKFTPENGEILLKVVRKNDETVVEVKDSGRGIPKDDLDKLFKKFQQLSRDVGGGAKGTGLGLAVVKALVELHQGQVWVTSEENVGTTFGFSLPGFAEQCENFAQHTGRLLAGVRRAAVFVVSFSIPGSGDAPDGDDMQRCVMNRLLQMIVTDIEHPEKRFFPHSRGAILIVIPEEDRKPAFRIYHDLRNGLAQLSFVYRGRILDAHCRLGMALAPKDGIQEAELVRAAMADMDRKRSILVVDDNDQIVHYLDRVLTRKGFAVRQAYSGDECLRAIRDDGPPDLLVLDIMMPDLNGYELYGRLKSSPETADIPVLIYTEKDIESVTRRLSGFDVSLIVNKKDGAERLLAAATKLL